GASVPEINAFLNGQNKVTAYVGKYMDAQDWFKDSPVPPDVRAYVDGVLKDQFDTIADDMKLALSDFTPGFDLTKTPLYQLIGAFGGAIEAVQDNAKQYVDMAKDIAEMTARVAVGFVPVVGQTLDFCEAVTGRAWCMPDGAELSDEERIFAGAGVALGAVG